MTDNDPVIQEALRIIKRHSLYIEKHFREKNVDELWKAASAINIAAADIVRHIIRGMP
jgi:hypothetical protein